MDEIKNMPLGHTFMLSALDFDLGPTINVILVGETADQDTRAMLNVINKNYLPNSTIKIINAKIEKTQQPIAGYEKIDNKTTAYICIDQTCMPPTNEIEKIVDLLKN